VGDGQRVGSELGCCSLHQGTRAEHEESRLAAFGHAAVAAKEENLERVGLDVGRRELGRR
jgi:hypothetical protein